jgi:transporter family-2 protein
LSKEALALLATVLAGGVVALQAPFNSTLGKSIGSVPAASVNFAVGTLLLVAITLLFAGGYGRLPEGAGLPWYYWAGGGMVGATYVAVALLTVRELGASGVTAATITGQLAASLVLDRLGVLVLQETPLTPARVFGVLLLVVGTVLIVR